MKKDNVSKSRRYRGEHGIKAYLRERKPLRDEQGRAIINMTVRNDDSFLSEFSAHSTPVISSDVADYLIESAKAARPTDMLTLRIHSDCVDDREDDVYRSAIKEYFGGELISVERELKKSRALALLAFACGMLVLVFTYWFGNHFDAPMWFEVFDIIATVFIWEATGIFAFQVSSQRVERLRCIAFISMKTEFYSLHGSGSEIER